MESIFTIGLQIIQWFQSLGAWLTPIMQLFTFLGGVQFYLVVAPAILWCVDANLGIRLAIYLMISESTVSILKMFFHGPRPYWYSSNVKVLGAAETNFGLPSGHTQNSVVVWGRLAGWINRRAVWLIAVILMFLIGVSRIYLAVHFPHDILFGWVFGAIILLVLLKLEKPVISWIKKYRAGTQVLFTFLFSLFLILLAFLAQLPLGGWNPPMEWINNAHLAFPSEPPIDPLSYHNVLTGPGALFGLAAGWIWISKLGGFTTHDPWWKLLVRYIVGVIGVLALYIGLGSLFPEVDTPLSYGGRYIRYSILGFWATGIAPWLFVKLRLASHLEGEKNTIR